MEIKNLKNIGVQVVGLNSAPELLKQKENIFKLLMNNSVVVFKGLDLSKKDFADISNSFGNCNMPKYYFNDIEQPEIFLVTNERVNGNKAGMFSDHELHWHANGCSRKSTNHHGVGLYCVMSESEVETEWCDTRKAFQSLSQEDKNYLSKIEINVGVGDFAFYLLGENDPEKEIMLRQQGGWKPLVGKHPHGEHLYCLFHNYFIQEVRHASLGTINKDEFINAYLDKIINPDFIYSHRFVAGDLVLSDQLYSIHRRGPVDGNRLLYRSAFDYAHSQAWRQQPIVASEAQK
ncbi:TauD/TfdA family dioxygenase [bacterium]|nr:TauD/TfdA family dioxygenase [bacterium]